MLAVERLATFRQFEAQGFSSAYPLVTTDFEELYACKCAGYRRCLVVYADSSQADWCEV